MVSVQAIQQAKRTVVPVVCEYHDNAGYHVVAIIGTGFFIDQRGRFVTASHVFDDWEKIAAIRHPCESAIYVPQGGWRGYEANLNLQYFDFNNCARDKSIDLAVCQPAENPFASERVRREDIATVVFDETVWPEGTPIGFTGFPLESGTPITSRGEIGGYRGIKGLPGNFDFIIDKAAWPGVSGSPTYLSNGKVIGILLQSGTNQSYGLSVVRSAAAITRFLVQHPTVDSKPR